MLPEKAGILLNQGTFKVILWFNGLKLQRGGSGWISGKISSLEEWLSIVQFQLYVFHVIPPELRPKGFSGLSCTEDPMVGLRSSGQEKDFQFHQWKHTGTKTG